MLGPTADLTSWDIGNKNYPDKQDYSSRHAREANVLCFSNCSSVGENDLPNAALGRNKRRFVQCNERVWSPALNVQAPFRKKRWPGDILNK